MNQRERILLLAVGATVLLIGGYFGYSWLSAKFDVRYQQISGLEEELQKQKRLLEAGKITAKRVHAYEQRALPPQIEQASSLYREFLLDIADELAGLRNVNVKINKGNSRPGVYQRLSFMLTADGNLEEFTQFLYFFYSVDYLHRIHTMHVTPLDKSKDLQLTVTIEALSLTGAPERTELKSGPANRLALASEADYLKVILERNLFGPPNQPPKIAALSVQQATTKKPFSFEIKAAESDVLDKLKFELDSPSASGAALKPGEPGKPGEPQSAQFTWTPPAKGEYTFTVRTIDDGLPKRKDEKTFKIMVKDEARVETARGPTTPPPLKFDVSKHTYLTSILERDGEMGIWLIERTTSKRIELKVGDKFDIGSMKGVVTKIGLQEIELEVKGKRLTLPLGSSLFEAAPNDL